MKQKASVKVYMHCDKCRKKAMTIAVQTSGVKSATIKGDDETEIEVTGDAMDIYKLVSTLRKKVGYAELLSVAPLGVPPKPKKQKPKSPPPQPVVRLPDYYVCEVTNDHCNPHPHCAIM